MTHSAFDPRELLEQSRIGVLATIKSSGLPQLSPVTPFYDRDADTIRISVTEGRAKTANLRPFESTRCDIDRRKGHRR